MSGRCGIQNILHRYEDCEMTHPKQVVNQRFECSHSLVYHFRWVKKRPSILTIFWPSCCLYTQRHYIWYEKDGWNMIIANSHQASIAFIPTMWGFWIHSDFRKFYESYGRPALHSNPIASMGLVYLPTFKSQPNVGKYSIHGSYGNAYIFPVNEDVVLIHSCVLQPSPTKITQSPPRKKHPKHYCKTFGKKLCTKAPNIPIGSMYGIYEYIPTFGWFLW